MKKKIAILLSGHLRTALRTYKNFYKKFINNLASSGYDCDVYISTWDTNTENSSLGGVSAHLTHRELDIKVLKHILNDIYKPKKLEIEPTPINDYEKFARISDSLKKKYPNLNKEIKSQKHARLNSPGHIKGVLSQLYKIKKAYELIDNPDEYDAIIKYRFDLFIEDVVDWSDEKFIDRITSAIYLRTRNKIYPDGTTSWGDTVVMGPPNFMKYFCLSYDYITDMNKNLQLCKNPAEADIFTITHIVNAVFDLEDLKDKLRLYTKGEYQPFNSYICRPLEVGPLPREED